MAPFHVQGDTLSAALGPATKLQMIAVQDIGWFGARAFTDAAALNRREINLAGDVRTMPEAAEILTQALGRPITFVRRQSNRSGGPGGHGIDAGMVRARRLQRRHRPPGTRVRSRADEAPRLGTPADLERFAEAGSVSADAL